MALDEAGGGAGGGSSKAAAEARYARQIESSINAMLASTLGPGKAQVKVNADLNVDETTREGADLRRQGHAAEDLRGDREARGRRAPTTGGTAGTGSNVPTYSARDGDGGAATPTTSEQEGHRLRRQQEGHARPKVAGGAVNKLNVALLVDKSVPADVFNSLQKTVAAAAGLDTARGDTISRDADGLRQGRDAQGGPGARRRCSVRSSGSASASPRLLFLFFMTRGMRKREGENLGTPAWLTEIDEPVSLAQLEARTGQSYARQRLQRRCCRRASRTPACISSTS